MEKLRTSPPATKPNGRAYLDKQVRFGDELWLRRLTAHALWGSVVVIGVFQQAMPWGTKIPWNLFGFFAIYALAPLIITEFAYRKWSPRAFLRCEAILLTAAWGLIAAG